MCHSVYKEENIIGNGRFGTRPEAIKMAPLILQLKNNQRNLKHDSCDCTQHRQMLDRVLQTFNIGADIGLNIMGKQQTCNGYYCKNFKPTGQKSF